MEKVCTTELDVEQKRIADGESLRLVESDIAAVNQLSTAMFEYSKMLRRGDGDPLVRKLVRDELRGEALDVLKRLVNYI